MGVYRVWGLNDRALKRRFVSNDDFSLKRRRSKLPGGVRVGDLVAKLPNYRPLGGFSARGRLSIPRLVAKPGPSSHVSFGVTKCTD